MRKDMTNTLDLVVNEIAATMDVPAASLGPDTSLSDIGMDSLQALQLLVALEQSANIQLGEEDLRRFTTVRSIVDLLNMRWEKAGAA
jgi:acyl carrier protein